MTAGVYLITNTKDGKVYVGESGDIERRWKFHLENLAGRCHHNPGLQAAFDEGGAERLRFTIVVSRVTDKTERLALELKWTEANRAWSHESGYNVDLRGEAIQDWIAKKKEALLEREASDTRNRRTAEVLSAEESYLRLANAYLEGGELDYEEREGLIGMLEDMRDSGISLLPDIQAAVDKICATKNMKAAILRAFR
jgi:predicted GIY-YIG superfamily endonuclease